MTWRALGTTVEVLVLDPAVQQPAERLLAAQLAELDAVASRFRDSELTRLRPGRTALSPVLAGAVGAALATARWTGGLVDPTVGASLTALGYDRTFASVATDGPAVSPVPAAGWQRVRLEGEVLDLPPGVCLDLGASAKAWAADVAAARLAGALGTGVLVNLGGDLAVAGPTPVGGWPVGLVDVPQTVELDTGGLATSSTRLRAWRRAGQPLHHVVDPLTGRPADPVWRTVTVAAGSCLTANAASTAAVVLGRAAPAWLEARGLPARLVAADGTVVRTGGWPCSGS